VVSANSTNTGAEHSTKGSVEIIDNKDQLCVALDCGRIAETDS
jgi:hypothetical protein